MQLSIHYYVLSLSQTTSRLFEGFRDSLIDIQNGSFPLATSPRIWVSPLSEIEQLSSFLCSTDEHFASYFKQDPLWLVLIGEQKFLTLFETLTLHGEALIGKVAGDFMAVSTLDLGRIVWPVIKKVLAGTNEYAIHKLEDAADSKRIITGFGDVKKSLESDVVYSLFVEEGYHEKRAKHPSNNTPVSLQGHINEAIDDPVDILVERVLALGGVVVFLESDSMTKYHRIALIMP